MHSAHPTLIRCLQTCEPGAIRGALVTLRDLWPEAARWGLTRDAASAALLAESREMRLSLHRHDYPASLTPEQLAELMPLPDGSYAVGVAIRQS